VKQLWQNVAALTVTVAALLALGAGLVFGYYGAPEPSVPHYRCEVENIAGAGPMLVVTPAVAVVAAAGAAVMPEVVSRAPAPRLSVSEVVVRGARS
jgi:hypothetical protein